MVEVFKTNVPNISESVVIVDKLLLHFPQNKINFDLGDCDRILRVEGENICAEKIVSLVTGGGYECEILF